MIATAATTAVIALASFAGVSEGFAALSPSPWSAGSSSSANGDSASSSPGAIRPQSVRMMSSASGSASVAAQQTYDLQSWAKGYDTADAEDQYLMEPSEGSVPKDIEGTFFRNGPGKFKVGEDLMKHPFDGDGMVTAISFSEEGAYFRNRFVRTKGYTRELEAGKMLYRGFGNLPGGPLKNAFRIKRKNLANTNVVFWGGNLLALWEGGLPHRLDPKSLDTLGETMLGDTIDEKRPTFSAHPRMDTNNDRLVGFGSNNMKESMVYEYDNNFKLIKSRLVKEARGLLHDFAVTKDHYIFYSAPVDLSPLKWILGLDAMSSALKWAGDKKGSTLVVVPRDASKQPKEFPIPAGFCFHLANAYDDSQTGEVVVDTIEAAYLALGDSKKDSEKPVWDTIDFTTDVAQTSMKRYRLDVSSEKGALVDCSTVYERQLDFPIVNPEVSCREHRYVWATCGALDRKEPCPVQGVVKIDTIEGKSERWMPEAHEFMGESTFVPRKGAAMDAPEDYGYLASVLVNGRDRRTEVIILDAANVSKGPICRLPLKGFVPHSLHGGFYPELVFTPDQVEKSFKLTDLFRRKGWNVAKSEFSGLGLNSVMD